LENVVLKATDLVDEGSFEVRDEPPIHRDPLRYPSYAESLEKAKSRSGSDESVQSGAARIGGRECELAVFDFDFFGGSMGEVTGERLARAMERAAERAVPFVLVTSTGGARMQEGMRSLVQMSKVVSARLALGDSGQTFVAVLSHPTTGGVLASLAGLADYTVAVAGATVGFAGPRLVERQTERPLREGSHRAESALAAGLVDAVVPPGEARETVARLLEILSPDELSVSAETSPGLRDVSAETSPDAWASVEAARDPGRAAAPDLAAEVLDPSAELRGDRAGKDDPGVRVFLGRAHGRRVLVVALDRRHPPGPHAYRKAIRALGVASRLDIPVVTLVDTPGADASEDSEAEGVAWAIAATFEAMLAAPVPILAIVTGEGGSGGALALASGDRLLVYDDTIFSVIGPELAAEILFRDPGRAQEAAGLLKPTAADLVELGIADELLPGPPDADSISHVLAYHLDLLQNGDPARRRRRWRSV
jgi:acetyl-CoA carboxylase carboxyl transferase subunit beta